MAAAPHNPDSFGLVRTCSRKRVGRVGVVVSAAVSFVRVCLLVNGRTVLNTQLWPVGTPRKHAANERWAQWPAWC